MRNYFRIANRKECFFFDDVSREETKAAYAAAKLFGDPVLYWPVPHEGPWDCRVVGHRSDDAINRALSAAQGLCDAATVVMLQMEIAAKAAHIATRRSVRKVAA